MTKDGFDQLKTQLRRDEGSRLESYRDTAGNLSIGVGHNINAHGVRINEEIEDELLEEDMARAIMDTQAVFPWVHDLDEPRQRVLYNMAFNMGIRGLSGFTHTLVAVKAGHYADAADRMLKSRWASQVGQRADRLAETMRTGVETV